MRLASHAARNTTAISSKNHIRTILTQKIRLGEGNAGLIHISTVYPQSKAKSTATACSKIRGTGNGERGDDGDGEAQELGTEKR